MAYWKTSTGISTSGGMDANMIGGKGSSGGKLPEFYEIEPAVVLDIILDDSHPYFKPTSTPKSSVVGSGFKIDPNRTPKDVSGKKPLSTDLDYAWVGRALVRLITTHRRVEKEDCVWALPLESNVSEYPLLNELVAVVKHLGTYYYTRKINQLNFVNANPDFNAELLAGGFRNAENAKIEGNRELQVNSSGQQQNTYVAYQGPKSDMNVGGSNGWSGVLGRYFLFNERIRALKRREGDLIFESRFGQSVRFAAYDDVRANDKGWNSDFAGYTDYSRKNVKYSVPDPTDPTKTIEREAGCGNPMILIRNRQRPITTVGRDVAVYPSTPVPPVKGLPAEKNTGGYIVEDVNNDGSSLHMTSGTTLSSFVTTCKKKLWGAGEEQPGFLVEGATTFKYPKLIGDQIVINSDRVIMSAKAGEMFHYSKKRMAFVTDNEFTVDAHQQIVVNTNTKTVINSPAIYLGEYDQTNEPVLLGQTSVNWLYDLCKWLESHTHWYRHSHPSAGAASPEKTQTSVQVASLITLREKLNLLMSRRVFVVGGGLAPGKNGGSIVGEPAPVSITIPGGGGVPGGFTGMNRKGNASATGEPELLTDEAIEDVEEENKDAVEDAVEESAEIKAAIKEMKELIKKDPKNKALRANLNYAQKQLKESKKNAIKAKKAAKQSQKYMKAAEKAVNPYQKAELEQKAMDASNQAKDFAKSADKNSKSVTGTLSVMKNLPSTPSLPSVPNIPSVPSLPNTPNIPSGIGGG